MRMAIIGSAALLVAGLAGTPAAAAPTISGDYIEARSCNLFVGACHAEGERHNSGNQAILAWKVNEGSLDGVSLDGVAAVAVVTADKNLALDGAKRKSVIYVDAANCAQKAALVKLLKEKAGASLGSVQSVEAAKVTFDTKGDLYQVTAAAIMNRGAATIKAKKEPGELCCQQKYEVWYKPFVSIKDSKIGYGVLTEFKDKTLSASWASSNQNNAYFGTFSF